MNAQVETTEIAETEEVAEVVALALPAGGMEKYKVVVTAPAEGAAYAQGEFGPYDTTEKAAEVATKFGEKGYGAEVAVIFTCGSAALALRQWAPAVWPEMEIDETDENEPVDNADAVQALLAGLDEASGDKAESTETETEPVEPEVDVDEGRVKDVDEAFDAATAENEAKVAEAAKPRRARRARKVAEAEVATA